MVTNMANPSGRLDNNIHITLQMLSYRGRVPAQQGGRRRRPRQPNSHDGAASLPRIKAPVPRMSLGVYAARRSYLHAPAARKRQTHHGPRKEAGRAPLRRLEHRWMQGGTGRANDSCQEHRRWAERTRGWRSARACTSSAQLARPQLRSVRQKCQKNRIDDAPRRRSTPHGQANAQPMGRGRVTRAAGVHDVIDGLGAAEQTSVSGPCDETAALRRSDAALSRHAAMQQTRRARGALRLVLAGLACRVRRKGDILHEQSGGPGA
jgi:hypothetical protein